MKCHGKLASTPNSLGDSISTCELHDHLFLCDLVSLPHVEPVSGLRSDGSWEPEVKSGAIRQVGCLLEIHSNMIYTTLDQEI